MREQAGVAIPLQGVDRQIHQLLDVKDPMPTPLVILRLRAEHRENGAAQK